jgi:hypothetical protein
LVTQSGVNGREWLELGDESELVLRHGESARELSLQGPGRFLPCRAGLEQVLIASGKLQSSPGTGVRPGAEVWVATPFGALRYADANIEVAVERTSLQVRVRGGQAFIEAAEGLQGAKEGRLTGPNGRASANGKLNAEGLVSACERAARAAEDSGRQLLGAKPGELGKLAAAQVRSRREARGRCLVAAAGVAQLEDPAAKARLGDQLSAHEKLWRGIPTPSGDAPQPRR